MTIAKKYLLFGFFLLVTILIARFLFLKEKYREIHPEEVQTWREKLQPAYFKGIVYKIGTPDNRSHLNGSIYIKLIDSNMLSIPKNCEYLKLKKNFLVLDASHLNISTGPQHAVFPDDTIIKNRGSDSVIILAPDGSYKYYFELFDGMAGPVKMKY